MFTGRSVVVDENRRSGSEGCVLFAGTSYNPYGTVFKRLGIRIACHLKRLQQVIVGYLEVADGPEEEARLAILETLKQTITHAWPRYFVSPQQYLSSGVALESPRNGAKRPLTSIREAGMLSCTRTYVLSLPSGLKVLLPPPSSELLSQMSSSVKALLTN